MLSLKTKIYIVIYILLSALILSLSIMKTINDTNSYIDNIFERIGLTIRTVGQLNAQNVKEIHAIIDAGLLASLRNSEDSNVKVYHYKKRNEFGFNQGIFPRTETKGTLVGKGKPTTFVIGHLDHLIVLDRMWAFYDQRTIFNDHFLFNYRANYIYLSNSIQYLSEEPLYPQLFDNRLFLTKNIREQEEKYGYFFSRPYVNQLNNEETVSVLSPVYENGELISHIGMNITLSKLASTISLYPEIQDKVDLYIQFEYNDEEYMLSKGNYDYGAIFTREYKIDHFGKLVVVYYISLIMTENMSLFFLLLILGILLAYNLHRRIKTQVRIQEITEQINQDNMTNLYNRRGLETILCNEITALHEENIPSALLAIDAEKFKLINDIHGHLTGDLALQFIAQTMQKCTRESDFLIRMGGDEFLAILPNADSEQAAMIAQRMDDHLKNNSEIQVGANVKITHACTMFDPSETFDTAFQRVDELMYAKKAQHS